MSTSNKTYSELLKHPRWQKKRLAILERSDFKCERCDDSETTLHIHHGYYQYELKPWDYPNESLHCLCEVCHDEITEINTEIKTLLGKIDIESTKRILGFIRGAASFKTDIKCSPFDDEAILNGFSLYFNIPIDVFKEKLKAKGHIMGGWDLIENLIYEGWKR